LVDHVPKSQRHWKGKNPVELKLKWIKAGDTFFFLDRLMAEKHDAKFGLSHRNMAHVSHPQHQGLYSVKRGYDDSLAEQELGRWSGEANKDQTGDNGHAGHPDYGLGSSDQVAVEGIRVHVPVANGGQGLDAEKKAS
jgi:hypothetical protein